MNEKQGIEFTIKTYEVHEDRITCAEGRIVSGPTHAIISLRSGARPDTVDYLLRQMERGVNEMPALLAELQNETSK